MISRYEKVDKINNGLSYGTSKTILKIRNAINSGVLEYDSSVLLEGQRLDALAGQRWGNSRLWWVIAAASGIGFGLQAPPGTQIKIPKNINDIFNII